MRDERHFTFDYDFGDSWEHQSSLEWVGGPFDPTEFDLGEVNTALQRIR